MATPKMYEKNKHNLQTTVKIPTNFPITLIFVCVNQKQFCQCCS